MLCSNGNCQFMRESHDFACMQVTLNFGIVEACFSIVLHLCSHLCRMNVEHNWRR